MVDAFLCKIKGQEVLKLFQRIYLVFKSPNL